jgi:hypothetical protein
MEKRLKESCQGRPREKGKGMRSILSDSADAFVLQGHFVINLCAKSQTTGTGIEAFEAFISAL